MTNQQVLFESHKLLCKPQCKSTGADELLTHGLIRVRCCVVQDNLGNFRGFALESER